MAHKLHYCLLKWPSPSTFFLTCGVVLQHWVFTEGFVPPGDQDVLNVGWSGVVTAQDHRSKQHRAPLRLRNNHLDGQQLWYKQMWQKIKFKVVQTWHTIQMTVTSEKKNSLSCVLCDALLLNAGLIRIWPDWLTDYPRSLLNVHALTTKSLDDTTAVNHAQQCRVRKQADDRQLRGSVKV